MTALALLLLIVLVELSCNPHLVRVAYAVVRRRVA